MTKVGDRVGAMLSSRDGIVMMLGYGVRLEDEVPPDDIGWMGSEIQLKNPCLQLDSGVKVYGCECWWGSEDSVKTRLEHCEIVNVDINVYRSKRIDGGE